MNKYTIRLPAQALAAVRRAAEIRRQSVGDFVSAAAQEAAENVIAKTELVRVVLEDHRAMFDSMLAPPDPSSVAAWSARTLRRQNRDGS